MTLGLTRDRSKLRLRPPPGLGAGTSNWAVSRTRCGAISGNQVNLASSHLTVDLIRGGVSYKFDWGTPAGAAVRTAMPVKARPAPDDWNGFYLGAHGGYGGPAIRSPKSNSASGPQTPWSVPPPIRKASLPAFRRARTGNWASWWAGSRSLSGTHIKGSSNALLVGTPGSAQINSDQFTTLGSARFRAGFLPSPGVLLYATGGLAWTRLDQSTLSVPLAAGVTANGNVIPSWSSGWVAGGGVEARLRDTNWFLRAEYLCYDFGDSGNFVDILVNTSPFN